MGQGWRFDPGIVGGMNMIKTCAELKAIKGLIKKISKMILLDNL